MRHAFFKNHLKKFLRCFLNAVKLFKVVIFVLFIVNDQCKSVKVCLCLHLCVWGGGDIVCLCVCVGVGVGVGVWTGVCVKCSIKVHSLPEVQEQCYKTFFIPHS